MFGSLDIRCKQRDYILSKLCYSLYKRAKSAHVCHQDVHRAELVCMLWRRPTKRREILF